MKDYVGRTRKATPPAYRKPRLLGLWVSLSIIGIALVFSRGGDEIILSAIPLILWCVWFVHKQVQGEL